MKERSFMAVPMRSPLPTEVVSSSGTLHLYHPVEATPALEEVSKPPIAVISLKRALEIERYFAHYDWMWDGRD